MASTGSGTISIPPNALAVALDDCAKRWWGTSQVVKAVGFLIGAPFSVLPPEPVPFVVAVLTLLAELCAYRSDAIKSMAQQLRRKLDLQDGFNWQIPNTDLSDLRARCSWWVKRRARKQSTNTPYFASIDPPGPVRALRNITESAWWTKHLAGSMTALCWTIMVVGVIVSIIILIAALQTDAHTERVAVARIVTALIMLFVSLGSIKLAIAYGSLSKNSESSEKAAERALRAKPDELAAFKVTYDYHLNRAAGPLLPTWIWKLRRKDLNQTWEEHRNGPVGT